MARAAAAFGFRTGSYRNAPRCKPVGARARDERSGKKQLDTFPFACLSSYGELSRLGRPSSRQSQCAAAPTTAGSVAGARGTTLRSCIAFKWIRINLSLLEERVASTEKVYLAALANTTHRCCSTKICVV